MDRDALAADFELNRLNWDARADVHEQSSNYSLDPYLADPSHLSEIVDHDRHHIGLVDGQRLVHLQCHTGNDTLSWARLGAEVTGVDLSPRSIEVAEQSAAALGLSARFVTANVYDSPSALDGERFDIVYTGVGALNWLPDIGAWAQVVADLLLPGGRLYVRDAHPMANALMATPEGELFAILPYFEQREPMRYDSGDTYTEGGRGAVQGATTFVEWNHGIADILRGLRDAGLVLDDFVEHTEAEWPQFSISESDGRWYRLPEKFRNVVPLHFTLKASRPG